jgi:transposase
MAQLNRYFRFAKISEAKFRHLLRCFALDLMATQTAAMTGLSVRSVNDIFLRLRRKIASECERRSPFGGVLEADESYFGPRRVRGKRGRGAGGKTIVFGLLKRGDQVYTEIVPNASKAMLQAIIGGKASPKSVLHTDGWRGYDGLVDLGFDKHFRVSHGDSEFASGTNHITGPRRAWEAGHPLCPTCDDPCDGSQLRNWTTFQSQRGASCQNLIHPLWCLEASVGAKPTVPHTDAEAASDPPQYYRKQECRPTEYEQCN